MSGRRSALSSKVAQTDGHSKPGKVAQFAGMPHPDLRPDRPPAHPGDIAASPDGPAHGQLTQEQEPRTPAKEATCPIGCLAGTREPSC
jgi:hypothetical protein